MGIHVIVGAGPVGSATARLLADREARVRVVTRRGTGPRREGIELVATDAAQADRLAELTDGAEAIYNCANPPYHRWPQEWPPLAASLLAAAERNDAVLVTCGNLYGYGPLDHPMRETDPLAATGPRGSTRARMWADALAAHEAGRVRVTEARGSDFLGPEVTNAVLGERVVPRLLAGKGVRVLGDPDASRSWTYVPDMARMLVTAGSDERAWGRAWHVPSAAPRSSREAVHDLCRAAGVSPVSVGSIPAYALKAAGLVVPELRGMSETAYQFDRPFVMDSSAATLTFGLEATPWDEACAATVAWFEQAERQAA